MKYAIDLLELFFLVLSFAGGTGLLVFIAFFWAAPWVRVATSTTAFVIHLNMILPESYVPTFVGRLKAGLNFFSNPMVLALLATWGLLLWLYYRWKRTSLKKEGERE